jgi:hypothetical protein
MSKGFSEDGVMFLKIYLSCLEMYTMMLLETALLRFTFSLSKQFMRPQRLKAYKPSKNTKEQQGKKKRRGGVVSCVILVDGASGQVSRIVLWVPGFQMMIG